MSTYDEILSRMVSEYERLSGFAISDQSDVMLRLKVLAGEIYNSTMATEFLKRQMFFSTATGQYLDKHALSRGLERKKAQKAVGKVCFIVNGVNTTPIYIDKGTVVSTFGPDARQFVTDRDTVLASGNTEVTVSVTAIESGSAYNVRSGMVNIMVTPPSGIKSVINFSDFSGGTDEETDEELRERLLYSYRDISNGTNAVYYKRLSESVSSVYSANVVSKARGNGTVDIYICAQSGSLVSDNTVNEVQQLIDENRELNVDVKVVKATALDVSFTFTLEVEDGYDADELKSVLTQKITDYIYSLGVGQPVLLCDLGDVIYHTDGVKNYAFEDAFCADVAPLPNEYCVLKKLDIRVVS